MYIYQEKHTFSKPLGQRNLPFLRKEKPMNQAYSISGSQNTSHSQSNTYGTQASTVAQQVTANTNNSAMDAWQKATQFNSEEARIQREWQERMANSIYQRTVDDMKKAGINPVLAAGMGLGTGSVGGGSAASISPSQVYNAQTFPDSSSYSDAYGSSYSQSENGIVTLANALSDIAKGFYEKLSSSQTINIAIDGLKDLANQTETTDKKTGKTTTYDKGVAGVAEKTVDLLGGSVDEFKDFFNTGESKKIKYMQQRLKNDKLNNKNNYQYHNNGF